MPLFPECCPFTPNNELNFTKPVKEISPSSVHRGICWFFPFLSAARWVQSCKENVAGRLLLGLALHEEICSSGSRHLAFPTLAPELARRRLAGLRSSGRAEEEVKSSMWKCSGKPKRAVPIAAGELATAAALRWHSGQFPQQPAAPRLFCTGSTELAESCSEHVRKF